MLTSEDYWRIRNNIILKGIEKGGNWYNDYVFSPLNESGYHDFRFYFPVSCISRSSGKLINIRDNREGRKSINLMNQGRTDQVMRLWERLEGIDKLREMIIYLSDYDLQIFRHYLCSYGLTRKKLQYLGLERIWNINYFSSDFYLPEYGIVLELDSKGYHRIPEIDKARDLFILHTHNIQTHRFLRYDLQRDLYEERLQKILRPENKLEVPRIFNQLDMIIEGYLGGDLKSLYMCDGT